MALPLTDQIRRVIQKCGISRYAISKATGVDQSTLARFMAGKQGLPSTSLDAIGRLLRLNVYGGRIPALGIQESIGNRNVDAFRVRCVNNQFDSVISEFPKLGFKEWEAEERERISRLRGEPVTLTHYRLDSPSALKYLTPEQRRAYGLDDSVPLRPLTRFVLRLNNVAGGHGGFVEMDINDPGRVVFRSEIALAQKWPNYAAAARARAYLVSSKAAAISDIEIEEIAEDTTFSLTLGEGEWPDAIEVLEEGNHRILRVCESGEEVTNDLDNVTANVLVRVLAKVKALLKLTDAM